MSSSSGPRLFEALSHAKIYNRFRPTYPSTLMTKVKSFVSEKCSAPFNLAVDVGCGSGQSSRSLAPHFMEVIGIDVSDAQLQQARENTSQANVIYRRGSDQMIPVKDGSADIITCAQSLHWFDMPKFFQEVKRTLKQNGCLVVYGYGSQLPYVDSNKEIQQAMQGEYMKIFQDILGPYWDERRKLVNTQYQDVHLPFTDFRRDDSLVIETQMTVDHMLGYIRSWSSYQTYMKEFPEKGDFLLEYQQKFLDLLQPTNPELPAERIQFNLVAPIFILMGRDTMD